MKNGIDRSTAGDSDPADNEPMLENATPELLAALDWFFTLSPRKFELVLRRLNLEVNSPDKRMSEDAITRLVEDHIRDLGRRSA